MRTQVTKDNIENIFNQKVKELTTEITSLTVINSLELTIEFFKDYEIMGVDTTIRDNDMLLFEYGIYDWQDGKGENFTVNLTRQFYMENELTDGFFQLHLKLYFNSENFKQLEALNKWSIDFQSINDWKNYITDTDGFKHAKDRIPKSIEVFFIETD